MAGMEVDCANLSKREHARISIAILHEGSVPHKEIESIVNVSQSTIRRWTARQVDELAFEDLPRPGINQTYTEAERKRLVAFFCQTTMLPDGHGRWTLRSAEKHLGHNPTEIGIDPAKSTIQRILAAEGLKPHRKKYFLHVTDPQFFPKMERLLELRRNPPANLFYFDECPGIHVRQRLSPRILSGMSKAAITQWLEEFEYIRHGTLDVFAFLDNNTGKIYGECRADHTKGTFHSVFRNHVDQARKHTDGQLHYVMDNLASHRSYELCCLIAELCGIDHPKELLNSTAVARQEWLGSQSKQIVIHYTPYHGSWLNLVEIWFGILGRGCLAESYASPDELYRTILSFIEQWNQYYAHPFKFDYDGEGLHEIVVKRFIRMLNSPEEFNNRFLDKQLRLLYNLNADYWDRISPEIWAQLASQLQGKSEALTRQITADDKPKRKAQTMKSFKRLLRTLSNDSRIAKVA